MLSLQAVKRLSHLSGHLPSQARTIAGYAKTQHKLNTGDSIPALGFGTWQGSL